MLSPQEELQRRAKGTNLPLALLFLFACTFVPISTEATLLKGPSTIWAFSSPFDYGRDTYKGVAVEENGTCYIIGDSNGPLENDYSSTRSKVFVQRLQDGSIVWQRIFKDPSYDYYAQPGPDTYSGSPTSICSLDENTILIIYERHPTNRPGYINYRDYWMVWLSKADGSVLEVRNARGWTEDFQEKAYSIVPDARGGFLLVENGFEFYYYNSSRAIAWQMRYPFSNSWDGDATKTFAFSPNGELIAAGSLRYGGAGLQLPAVISYGQDGIQRWERYFPGNSADQFSAVCVDAAGNIYVANRGPEGTTIRKIDSTGSEVWMRSYAGLDSRVRLQIVKNLLLVYPPLETYSGKYLVLNESGTKLYEGLIAVSSRFGRFSPEAVYIHSSGASAAVGDNREFGDNTSDALIETFSFVEPNSPTPTPIPTPTPNPTPTPSPTPPTAAITSVKLSPAKRAVVAGKPARVLVTVANNSTQGQVVEVSFNSSNSAALPAPASIYLTVPGKRGAKMKPRTASASVVLSTSPLTGGVSLLTASAAGLTSAACVVTVKGAKAAPSPTPQPTPAASPAPTPTPTPTPKPTPSPTPQPTPAASPTPSPTQPPRPTPTPAASPTPPPVLGMIAVQGGSLPQSSQLAGRTVTTFYIGKYEVTWAEWQEIRNWGLANGYTDLTAVGTGASGQHPVRYLNWYDCVKWCNAKSEKEGLVPAYTVNGSVYRTGNFGIEGSSAIDFNATANGYRLPTESEWEWAARGGPLSAGFNYAGSNDPNEVGWYRDNASGREWPVGQKKSNELGIFDMMGNVVEWCWSEHSGTARRLRGGSFDAAAAFVWDNLHNGTPDSYYFNQGFRTARTHK